MMPDNRRPVFKSLETDREFADRVHARYGYRLYYLSSRELDDTAWASFGMQRKIVERGP